jgi:hypothetical protein
LRFLDQALEIELRRPNQAAALEPLENVRVDLGAGDSLSPSVRTAINNSIFLLPLNDAFERALVSRFGIAAPLPQIRRTAHGSDVVAPRREEFTRTKEGLAIALWRPIVFHGEVCGAMTLREA